MPKPLTPIINWNNPITKGLVFDMPLFERGGTSPIDIVSKGKSAFAGTSPVWSNPRLFGTALTFANNTNITSFTSPATQNSLSQITVEALVFPTSTNGDSRIIHKGSSTGVKYFDLALITGNKFEWAAGFSTADDAFDSPAVSALNLWYHVVVTYVFGTLGVFPLMYINSIPQTLTRVNGSGSVATDTTELNIGNRTAAGGSTKGWVGDMTYLRIWKRVLSQTEVKQLYTSPFQIYSKPITAKLNSGI